MRNKKLKIKCNLWSWCRHEFEIDESKLIIENKEKIDELGKVLASGFLGHWLEFDKIIMKYFYAKCPNCKNKIEIKKERGDVIGKGRVYYGG